MISGVRCEILIAIGVVMTFAALAAGDHPLHATRATVEFNAETRSFEVSLCAFPDDLEQGLSQFAGREISLDKEPVVDDLLRKYVAKEFELRLGDQQTQSMQWIGYELETQQAWLYFEFPVDEETPTDMRLKNTMFMDLFDDQINVAYARIGGRQRCITHRTDNASWQSWTPIRQKPDESLSSAPTPALGSSVTR